jgi:transcriptional regulator with XRE-family HTH domain
MRNNRNDRRILSSSLSAKVIDYLVRQGHSQSRIAGMLGVSQSFVSLIRSRERSLTIDHLERLTDELSVPLGAFLLAVTPPPKNSKHAKFFKLVERAMKAADAASEAILAGNSRVKRAAAR